MVTVDPQASRDQSEEFIRFARERWLLSPQEAERCLKRCLETGLPAAEVAQDLKLLSASVALIVAGLVSESRDPSDELGTQVTSAVAEPPPASVTDKGALARYEIRGELGRGAMAVVYEAHDAQMDRDVALKVLVDALGEDQDVIRFQREAMAIAGMGRHPNIVNVYDFGVEGGINYYTMERVDGEPLDEWLGRQPRSLREIVVMVAGAARGLAHAHGHGVIHRDVKPENVLVTGDGKPLVSDFGLARTQEVDSHLTATGMVLGTPAYMSPEQALGHTEDLSPAADVYGLGVVLYEALTGQLPFDAGGIVQTLLKKVEDDPPPPSSLRPDLPASLEAIILKSLARDVKLRYPDAHALERALSDWLARGSLAPVVPTSAPSVPTSVPTPMAAAAVSSRGWQVAAGVAGVVTVALVAMAAWSREAPEPEAQPRARAPVAAPVREMRSFQDVPLASGSVPEVEIEEPAGSLDTTPPVLEISSPRADEVVGAGFIVVGSVRDPHPESLIASDGTVLEVAEDGGFSWKPTLPEHDGPFEVRLTASDSAGNGTTTAVTVLVDRLPPVLSVDSPEAGALVSQAKVMVRGRVEDAQPVAAWIDGQALELFRDGFFEIEVELTSDGLRELRLEAEDALGRRAEPLTLTLVVDRTSPSVMLEAGEAAVVSGRADFTLRGQVEDAHPPDMITVAGREVSVDADGRFSVSFALEEERTSCEISCRDRAGNEMRFTRDIILDTTPPGVALDHQLPKGLWSKEPLFTLKGRLTEPGCQVLVNGEPAAVLEQRFIGEVSLKRGDNHIEVVAKDPAGHTARLARDVRFTRVSSTLVPNGTWWKPSKAQLSYAKKRKLPLWFENHLGMRFVLIPPGRFMMGSHPSEPGRDINERPHLVAIPRGFYLQATEVTNAQFRTQHPGYLVVKWLDEQMDRDQQPVEAVRWVAARDFGGRLSPSRPPAPRGFYRLPSEAEWEYACRAGTTTSRFWGNGVAAAHRYSNVFDPVTRQEKRSCIRPKDNDWPTSLEKFDATIPIPGDDGYRGTAPVGSYRPNPWGLLDMLGNVGEWCSDLYAKNHTGEAASPSAEGHRVIRRSCYRNGADLCRAAQRGRGEGVGGTERWAIPGFRLVLELSSTAQSEGEGR